MENLSSAVSLICCKAYKEDGVVRSFCGIFGEDRENALKSYASLCGALLSRNIALSDYLFFLAADAENPILRQYLSCRSEILLNALQNDLSVLSELASLPSEQISAYLRRKFPVPDSVRFPAYENGQTVISAESVLSYVTRFGSSVFEKNKAFRFENGGLIPAAGFDPVRLADLKNYRAQRQKIVNNTLCLLNGKKAQNVLLYGDRGTGKSSTVKALANEYPSLRLIQIPKSEIFGIAGVYEIVKSNPLKFILFLDDITFREGDEGYSSLKQALEGSIDSLPRNCAIYATTNRRHMMKETESERSGDELHAADARDENMSLTDRFGLYITFSSPGRDEYLDIVRQIAADRGIRTDGLELERLAERFALKKCGRSPRTAKQFVDILESRMELKLDDDMV